MIPSLLWILRHLGRRRSYACKRIARPAQSVVAIQFNYKRHRLRQSFHHVALLEVYVAVQPPVFRCFFVRPDRTTERLALRGAMRWSLGLLGACASPPCWRGSDAGQTHGQAYTAKKKRSYFTPGKVHVTASTVSRFTRRKRRLGLVPKPWRLRKNYEHPYVPSGSSRSIGLGEGAASARRAAGELVPGWSGAELDARPAANGFTACSFRVRREGAAELRRSGVSERFRYYREKGAQDYPKDAKIAI